jgi:membrane protein YqaA with SNARE-associated domain
MSLSAHPKAAHSLAAVSFIESSVFPIPPDVLLIPMVLGHPKKAFHYAFICTIASVFGGLFGYFIGYFLFETVGKAIIDIYHLHDSFNAFKGLYNKWGMWLVALAGFTPFPYKVITITSGLTELNLLTFTLTSIVSRGARFYLVSWLLYHYGVKIRAFIEKNFGLMTLLFFILLIGGFILLKYIF